MAPFQSTGRLATPAHREEFATALSLQLCSDTAPMVPFLWAIILLKIAQIVVLVIIAQIWVQKNLYSVLQVIFAQIIG